MKKLMNIKAFIAIVVMFFGMGSMNAQNVIKTWDFTAWSSATLTNLAADADEATTVDATKTWRAESATRYGAKSGTVGTTATTMKANEVDIADLEGLQFAVASLGDWRIRINHTNSSASLGLNVSDLAVSMLDLKKDDIITITFVTASGGNARGFTMTNVTSEDNAQNSVTATPTTNTYTVIADGTAIFTTTGGVNVTKITLAREAAGGLVDVILTDLKDLDPAPAVQATSGTFDLTVGKLTLNGPSWMRTSDNFPQIEAAFAADTVGKKWIRFGGNPNDMHTLASSQYVDFTNPDVPFVNGGTITALVSSNSENRLLYVYDVAAGEKIDSIVIGTPRQINEVSINLPETFNGVKTLRFARNDGGPFLWGMHITTHVAGEVDYTRLVFNEINGSGSDPDKYYELYNNGTEDINLEDVMIHYYNGTNPTSSLTWTGKDTDIIEAKGFFVVKGRYDATNNPDGMFTQGLSANNAGVKAYLFSPDGDTLDVYSKPLNLNSGTIYDALRNRAHVRIPDGTGIWYYSDDNVGSEGTTNGTEPGEGYVKFGYEANIVDLDDVMSLSFDSEPYTANQAAKTLRVSDDGNVMFGKVGTVGNFDYLETSTNNSAFELNTPGAGAFVVLSKDKPITRIKILIAAGNATNVIAPFVAFSSGKTEDNFVGSELPFDDDLGCAMHISVAGNVFEQHTYLAPAGTHSIFIARGNMDCGDIPANQVTFRMEHIEVYTDGGEEETPWINYSKLRINEVNGAVADGEKYVEIYNGGRKDIPLNAVTLYHNDALIWTGGATDTIFARNTEELGEGETYTRNFFVVTAPSISANNPNQKIELIDPADNTWDIYERFIDVNPGASWGDYDELSNKAHARIPNGTGLWYYTADNVGTKGEGNGSSTAGLIAFGDEDVPLPIDEAEKAMLILTNADIVGKFTHGVNASPAILLKESTDGRVRIGQIGAQGQNNDQDNLVGLGESAEPINMHFQVDNSNAGLNLNNTANDALVIQSKDRELGRIKMWISSNGATTARPDVFYNADTSDASWVGSAEPFANVITCDAPNSVLGTMATLVTYVVPPGVHTAVFLRDGVNNGNNCSELPRSGQTYRIYRIEVYDVDEGACELTSLSVDGEAFKRIRDTMRRELPEGTDPAKLMSMPVIFTTSPGATVRANGTARVSPYNQNFSGGPVTYEVTSANGANTTTYVVHIWVYDPASIEPPQIVVMAKIYPNPTNDVLNVYAENMRQVEVLDMLGRVILRK
ncbi:MAG: lamin tail domain-containing protein, partial [Bacteroidales bacterium]|nr:lamin tail domain-containing protein [Bacteroidales bacterium]